MANEQAKRAVLKAARKAGVQGDPTIYAARLDAARSNLDRVNIAIMQVAREAARGGFRDDANKITRINVQLSALYDQLKVIINELDSKS